MGQKQSCSKILMIRPLSFGYNSETAPTNKFQHSQEQNDTQTKALKEFDSSVQILREAGVKVEIVQDRQSPACPDAIFPNNWFSTHQDGTTIIYPMLSSNRQSEIRTNILDKSPLFRSTKHFIDMRTYVEKEMALEGTGSLVLDRANKVAYACLSERTNYELALVLCKNIAYKLISFKGQFNGSSIYHTNVMMSITTDFNIICTEALIKEDRIPVLSSLDRFNRRTVDISLTQMQSFLGNVLELRSTCGQKKLIISQTAFNSLNRMQKKLINTELDFVICNIPTIERIGGGSIRCMIAEIFP